MMTYGLRRFVARLPNELIIDQVGDLDNSFYKLGEQSGRFVPGSTVVRGNFTGGFQSSEEYWHEVGNRNFLIGTVNFGDINQGGGTHWATFILDRQTSVVYYYDTLVEGRQKRFAAFVVAFRMFLTNWGQPYNFLGVCCPVPDQKNGWACGLLSTFCVWQVIRSFCGLKPTKLFENCTLLQRGVRPQGHLIVPMVQLHIGTWDYWANAAESLANVSLLMMGVCMNELGRVNAKVTTNGVTKWRKAYSRTSLRSSWLQHAATCLGSLH
jgi:hypothetical protein